MTIQEAINVFTSLFKKMRLRKRKIQFYCEWQSTHSFFYIQDKSLKDLRTTLGNMDEIIGKRTRVTVEVIGE